MSSVQKWLTDDLRSKIDSHLAKYPQDQRQAALIPVLHIAQEENNGHLTKEILHEVAEYIQIPPISALEAASFYSMFELEPVGKYVINICTNVSCMLRGAEEIVAAMEDHLGIKLGETTADGKFTMKVEEECLAACSSGPVMTVNGHYHERLTPESALEILKGLE